MDSQLLVNELAPRPHNSGHYTFDACSHQPFEQQLRAVCGLPLGSSICSVRRRVEPSGTPLEKRRSLRLRLESTFRTAGQAPVSVENGSFVSGEKMGQGAVLAEVEEALALVETSRGSFED